MTNGTTTDELGGAAITVLQSLARPDGTTKYVDQIVGGAPADVHHVFFSWREALTGDYDVFHIHWPELLLRGRSRRLRFAKRQLARVLLWRLRFRGIALVRTLHNLTPHERGSAAERRVLAAIDRATTLYIRLNPTSPIPVGGQFATVLHGHYRERFAQHPKSDAVTGTIAYFGIIRPYKGVEKLVGLVAGMDDDTRLRVVGSPSSDLRDIIERAVDAAGERVTARLEFVSDADLVAEVTAAELVVLPYSEMHNSGAALVALSLDRPILVPRSDSGTALSDEVGAGWVTLYDGELTAETISTAMEAVRRIAPGSRPALEGRDWSTLGVEHRSAYQSAVRSKKARR